MVGEITKSAQKEVNILLILDIILHLLKTIPPDKTQLRFAS